MAGGFTPEFLMELKYKCDIADVIAQYVPLTKKGGRYFGCCPFHNEKTPSFCVTPESGFYHCFGCGVSGDVVSFVMAMESLSFFEAVKLLADKVGMVLPEFKADPTYEKKKEKRDILLQLMKDTARFYRNNLLREIEGKDAREYLQSRGISDEISARYGLGLSLNYDGLQGFMRRKGYTGDNLKDCGLVNGDNLSDAFANRIIVPIFNGMNDVIAFGGRIYHGEKDIAKYKNSTNTLLFDKSRTIYGINFIKKEKKDNAGFKELILVEGYMDVISLGAAGIRNAVAAMGTALTDGQARELKRLAPRLNVCYDGDSAGRNAAIKNLKVLTDNGIDVRVVSLADGFDPDDTIRADGYEGFMRLIEEALPVVDYKLKVCANSFDISSVNGRAKYVSAALDVLKSIDSLAEREVYFQVVSNVSGVSKASIAQDTEKIVEQNPQKTETQIAEKEAKLVIASRFVLNRLLDNALYADLGDIKKEWLPHTSHQSIFDFIMTSTKGEIKIGNLFDHISDDEVNRVLDVHLNFDNSARESEYFVDCVLVIANEYIAGRLDFLKENYNTLTIAEDKRSTIEEIQILQKKLKSKNIKDKL